MIVGGTTPSRIASTAAIAPTAPAAPIRCPTIDFGLLTARFEELSPYAAWIAIVSVIHGLDHPVGGVYPSDHYGVVTTLRGE